MNDFVAVDVETANGAPTSICSIGAVKVLDGGNRRQLLRTCETGTQFLLSPFYGKHPWHRPLDDRFGRHIRYRMASSPQIYRSASSCGP